MKRLDIHPSLFNLHSNASLNYSSKEGKVRGFDVLKCEMRKLVCLALRLILILVDLLLSMTIAIAHIVI